MSKLELKHLAPYLPYRLKTVNFNTNGLLKNPLCSEMIPTNILAFVDGSTESKIVLRPMSDLIGYLIDEDISVYKKLSIRTRSDWEYESPTIKKWSYEDIIILLQHHFDIFGLIPKGLAVDINTLSVE